jgi:hypothetical protein
MINITQKNIKLEAQVLAIVFSVLLRFTDSDYLFGIFKLFLIYFYIFTVLYF